MCHCHTNSVGTLDVAQASKPRDLVTEVRTKPSHSGTTQRCKNMRVHSTLSDLYKSGVRRVITTPGSMSPGAYSSTLFGVVRIKCHFIHRTFQV